MIGSLIEEMLANAQEHYETIQEAKGRPHAFDDALVTCIVQVHTDQLDDHWLFEQQLSRWPQDELSATQRREVERLQTHSGGEAARGATGDPCLCGGTQAKHD